MKKKLGLQDEFALALAPFNPVKGEHRDWRIQTAIGPLEVTLYDKDGQGPWIACAFLDVEKARLHFGVSPSDFFKFRLNPYSGKWNFHCEEWACRVRPSKADKQAAGRRMISAFIEEVKYIILPGGKQ